MNRPVPTRDGPIFMEKSMFKPVNTKIEFPELEKDILRWWADHGVPEKYMSKNKMSSKRYSFIDGPITANNPMGVHHAWGRTYKDLFSRFRTMQGYRQRYQNGFDGQGLWIEVEVEKELGFSSKTDIEKYGVDKFVTLCKERVDRFAQIITEQSIRLGQWMDWDNSYHTKSDENNYTIWHFLQTCHQKGLLYEGTDVMPWCPRCSTGLSEHEIVTEGYQEITHPGLFVKFPLIDSMDGSDKEESLLIWTTTPWTLTSNCAAAVNSEVTYVKVMQNDEYLYLAKSRILVLKGEYEVIGELKGDVLVGCEYKGPFDELPAQNGVRHRVVDWDEVTEGEGTGIVHTAPGAGKEDFELGKKESLAVIAPLDDQGNFVEGFDWLTGMNVYEVNDQIYENLKSKNIFYKVEQYKHRYPHCWRCGSELVFRLVDEWFIKMDPLRDSLARITRNINWVPEFGMKRELDWIKNMDDWMISKKRYYGLALPIYKCSCGNFDVIGSEMELKDRAVSGWEKFDGHSPHRPWIDNVLIECSECERPVKRVIDVGNPWLDAGIVSFSTLKFRADKDYWQDWFPADWISESFPGQYRNWFYSLLTMSVVLADSEPCRNIFSYALMRDEKGEEMHKSKGNAIWFEDAADVMGVDAIRWQFAGQIPSSNLNFGFSTADEVRRQFLIPLWNVYSFFVTYANIDKFSPNISVPEVNDRSELDRWILSELNVLIGSVTDKLESFQPERVTRDIENFVEYLSNWYVRRSRRRFWKAGLLDDTVQDADLDKLSAYFTLYEVLVELSKLMAPIIPFVTESMYQNLVVSSGLGEESVHLERYPIVNKGLIDELLSAQTRLAMRISSMGRSARSKAGIKVRQPIEELFVKTRTETETGMMGSIEEQLKDELNVKKVTLVSDASIMARFTLQPNLPVLGPKYGNKIPLIREALDSLDITLARDRIESGGPVSVGDFQLEPEDIIVNVVELEGFSAATDSGYSVGISTEISPELFKEGVAREFIHLVQNARRAAEFNISDRINIWVDGPENAMAILLEYSQHIKDETLSESLKFEEPQPDIYVENIDINEFVVTVGVEKIVGRDLIP